MTRSNFREAFTGDAQILPELGLVGWARVGKARVPGLEPHAHPNTFEFFLFERGGAEWWVEQEVYRLSANQVYINRPDELHGSVGNSLRPCGYFWIHLEIGVNGLPGMLPEQSKAICEEISSMRLRTFPGSPALKQAFAALWMLHRERPPHAALAIRAQLHMLLVQLLQDHRAAVTAKPLPSHELSYSIRKAVEAVDASLAEIKSVNELARLSGLGVTQFSDRFFAEVGFTPAMYLRKQRIERAKTLLRSQNTSLADIAQTVGFSSSQHLATAFKQLEGVTPTSYRRSL